MADFCEAHSNMEKPISKNQSISIYGQISSRTLCWIPARAHRRLSLRDIVVLDSVSSIKTTTLIVFSLHFFIHRKRSSSSSSEYSSSDREIKSSRHKKKSKSKKEVERLAEIERQRRQREAEQKVNFHLINSYLY